MGSRQTGDNNRGVCAHQTLSVRRFSRILTKDVDITPVDPRHAPGNSIAPR
jgi:hypothetical protein